MRPTASTSAQRAARRTALAIPSGPELPWPTTAMPRRPSRIAPPVVSGWNSRRRLASGRFEQQAAGRGDDVGARRVGDRGGDFLRAAPSISFSATLPVKPSVTTTSVVAEGRSRPSTLPAKEMPLACFSMLVGLDHLGRPLPASSPTVSRPTLGDSTPSTAVLKAAPRKANWTRCWARTSTLAPTSRKRTGLPGTGSCTASAGRCTPLSRRRPKVAAAIVAPVEPWLTIAPELPSATSRAARTTEASFFSLTRLDRVLVVADPIRRSAPPRSRGSPASASASLGAEDAHAGCRRRRPGGRPRRARRSPAPPRSRRGPR